MNGQARDWRGAILPLGFILLAELALRISGKQSDSLAPPSQIIIAMGEGVLDGTFLWATGQTLVTAVAGFALGGLLGLALGCIFGLSARINKLFEFSVEVIRPIPPIALLPIALLVFGFGYRMSIFIIAFACLWPVLLYARAAIQSIEPRLLEVARVLRLSPSAYVLKILLPASLPRLFVASRIASSIALIVAVTTEIAINPQGLGFSLIEAQQSLRPARMFALLVWVGMLGWLLNAGFHWLEQRLVSHGLAPVEGQP